ncbi:SAV_2336 N-terminal domain-related protein [Streptomyces polygonati]|uniref:SAV_2336 N-terminal domain-related protein n=1 Tax=Streptomyces polygonati TaxID=1617087 RepID=A0ABV8HNS6_9ACTN
MAEPDPGPHPEPPPRAPTEPVAPATAGRPPGPPADPPPGQPGPPSPPADPPTADPLAEVVAALDRSGLRPAATELADALWLARWSRPTTAGPDPAADSGPEPAADRTPPPGHPRTPKGDSTDGKGRRLVPPAADPPADGMISLYPGAGVPGRARPAAGASALGVTIPEAAALPKLLELQAALRPLQRYHSPARPRREVLDEAATADRTALAGGLMLPVFRPVPRGDAAMQLLMDASSSMFVWERMLRELVTVFERLGAFHEVQVRYLHATPEGELAVSGRFDPEPAGLRSAQQLLDPTGRRITLLVSDCVGPLWRSGQGHRLLHRLLRLGPTAVLQPLPARLWNRTRLPVSYGVLHRAAGLSTAAPLRFSAGAATAGAEPDALPVPVLPPAASALGAWARLLAGMGSGQVPAAVGWVRPDHPASHSAPRRTTVPVPALVGRFRSAASPAAAQLAVYLAAAPLFLPVMQLVQRTMLPDSGPAELAEVLLSGLLVRGTDEDHRWYHFADGVRDALLSSLGRDEALLVLKHCSQYVEQRFGKGGPNFPALAITQLTEGLGDLAADEAVRSALEQAARASGVREVVRDEELPAVVGTESPQPFAEVAARVLERFMPLPQGPGGQVAQTGPAGPSSVVRQARALTARFHGKGMVQNLLDAVQLLRAATAREGVRGIDPDLWSELAQQLVVLWRVRGGADLLREAQEAAETATAHPGSVRARAVRARVFQAAAEDRAAIGDDRGALELLRRADREFTAVCAAPGLDPRQLLDATLERVRVLEDQWQLGGDAGLLHETLGMLEAFADSWPPGQDRPSGLPLAHGRALLRLAGTARDRQSAAIFAQRAATSFLSGLDALEREDAPPEARHIATLSLIDAQLLEGGRLDEARRHLDRALGESGDDAAARAALLLRSGRIAVARYAQDGSPAELESAAGRFAEACRLTSRDRPEYREMVAEWGEALLTRAELPDGDGFVNRAVQVLRDCRMETPESDPMLPDRLLMLGRALILRYRAEEDLVDLREAEYVLGLALQPAVEPGQVARIWFELGESHRLGYLHTHRPERLDQAADAYRRAAESASAARPQAPEPGPMARLSARAHHWRGVVYESARRPRAAAEAYRAALAAWRTLPAGPDSAEAARTAQLLDALTRPA